MIKSVAIVGIADAFRIQSNDCQQRHCHTDLQKKIKMNFEKLKNEFQKFKKIKNVDCKF